MDFKITDITSLCKRRGLIFAGSQIYGGLAGFWDYGPLGVQLKRNIEDLFWRKFVIDRDDIYGIESSILMNSKVWEASGHTGAGFADPLVEDLKTKQRYRVDTFLEDLGHDVVGKDINELQAIIDSNQIKSPDGNDLSKIRQFNMMFKTQTGAVVEESDNLYLRPETAQGMFVNFGNVQTSQQPDLPFGIAQIGKAFRNEISPRDFTFRSREFTQMEIEYFCRQENREEVFEQFRQNMIDFMKLVGLKDDQIVEVEVEESERAHYSQRTIDFEFKFPFGQKELAGLADRGQFDLKNHQTHSNQDLSYITKDDQTKLTPVCIEPTFGLDRLILAVICASYRFDKDNDRTYLSFPEIIAPVRYAVSPLLKNKPELVAKARQVYQICKDKYHLVAFDDHGNIGKRYRRQDEIGTPYCLVVDFQTLEDETVTIRRRDDLTQKRIKIDQI